MKRTRAAAIGLWLLGVALALLVVARAHYSADLSAFLPRSPSPTQQMLVQQVRDGLPSRLILIGIDGADADARAQASRALAARLREHRAFVSVANGEQASEQRDRAFVFQHRYVLSEQVTAERFGAGLAAAIGDNLELMSSGAGLLAKELFVADPTGETLQIIEQLTGSAPPRHQAGVWSSGDGTRALLLAQTRAAGSDTDEQARDLELIRSGFDERAVATSSSAAGAPLRLLLSGPAVFAVDARATIEREALKLSLLSTALIVTLLLIVYRSPATLLLGLLPVASGALAGIAAVALGFGVVHGITLGFGVTLIGESVDYSIYLFIQSSSQRQPALWRTIGLGVLTSICGFASLLPSAFPGLSQLGLYSISGLLAAAAVTRFVLPALLPARLRMRELAPLGRSITRVAARLRLPYALAALLALLCAALLYHVRSRLWNRDIEALSPMSASALALDAKMRADLSAPDVGDLVVVSAPDEQAVLALAESIGARLDALRADGILAGYDSPAQYLPSAARQQARRASLPAPAELAARLARVSTQLGLQSAALTPFLQQVAAARTAPALTREDLNGTSFALAVDALLWHDAAAWHAMLPLHAPAQAGSIDLARVRQGLGASAPGTVLVLNIKQETDALYGSYLTEAMRLSLIGLGAIVLLLAATLRSGRRVAAVLAPLLLSVLCVVAGLVLAGIALTILHLIGMLLIVAVGSNYALFFDRRATDRDQEALPLTLCSLLIANVCTVVGFGILAFSHVPVLSALGMTVGPGTALALLFATALAPRSLFAQAAS